MNQDWSEFWPELDWMGLQFFENLPIKTVSDWEICVAEMWSFYHTKTFDDDPILQIW